MAGVTPRNWRQARPGQHTREVVTTKEELSAEAKALLISQQEQIDALRSMLQAMMDAIGSVAKKDAA